MEEAKLFGIFIIEHWLAVSVLLVLVYLVVTGQIRHIVTAKKIKAGAQGVEFEGQDLSLPKQENCNCPSSKCNDSIWGALKKLFARTEEIQKTHEERQKETLAYREKILNAVSVLEKKLEDVAQTIKGVQEDVSENSFSILKANFYNENLPDAERMRDGLRYLYKGKNGDVKEDVIKFVLDGREEMYLIIKTGAPKLRNADADAAIAKKRKGGAA